MGRRSRKADPCRRPRRGPPLRPLRGRRAARRNAEVRAQLRPLAPGERPLPLLIAIGISVVLGVGNLAAYAAGQEIDGERLGAFGIALLSACCSSPRFPCGKRRYWAVLAWCALGITVVLAALALLVAGNLAAVLVSVAIVGLGGWLFWKLVRIMARLQMPGVGGPG